MRAQGNAKFNAGDSDGAFALYLQSLAGLDFGDAGNAQHSSEAAALVQVTRNAKRLEAVRMKGGGTGML